MQASSVVALEAEHTALDYDTIKLSVERMLDEGWQWGRIVNSLFAAPPPTGQPYETPARKNGAHAYTPPPDDSDANSPAETARKLKEHTHGKGHSPEP
jgi:hypothetical protein